LNKEVAPIQGMQYEHDEIKRLSKSKSFTDRKNAAIQIRTSSDYDDVYILNELLKDENNHVVKAAIKSAEVLQNTESYSSLIELLGNFENSNAVIGTLISFGDKIIPALEIAFQKADQKENVMYKILYIYGQMGSELAREKLWQKISYPDLQILTIILKALHHLKVKASEDQINIVNTLLENEIRKAAWNISALDELDEEQHVELLREALEEEVSHNYNIIYILLSLLYDHQSIQLVRDNIESGTNEGRVFAVELLDVFIAKGTKELLFPLLDDVPLQEKIKNLQLHFPRETFNEVEVLKQIINRDYNNIGRWTKSCALYAYALTSKAPICNDLIANFFNPNNLIRETAAWSVVKKDKAIFKHILTRILNLKRNKNDLLLNELIAFADSSNQPILRIDKIVFLKSLDCFSSIPGAILAEFAETLNEVKLSEGEELEIREVDENIPAFIVFKGKVSVYNDDKEIKILAEKSFLDPTNWSFSEDKIDLVANGDSILFKINRSELYDFMIRHYELTEGILALSHSERLESFIH
jgi:ATP:ADP antiporter, AAA family